MGMLDKARNAAAKVVGGAKEKTGEHTGNRDLQAEGKVDQTKASLKNAGENVKDVFKD